MFHQRLSGLFFQITIEHRIGILVRVPLASGLLNGKISAQTIFSLCFQPPPRSP